MGSEPPSAMGTTTMAEPPSGYPVNYDVEYDSELNRWLPLIKWLLIIPQILVIYFVGIVASLLIFIAFFAILFTRKFPKGMFDFVLGYARWTANIGAYYGLMRDEYPPFSVDAGKYPVTLEAEYPEQLNRWLPLIKWLLIIPHLLVLMILWIIASFMYIIIFFAILFTKTFPKGMFDFIVGVNRWTYRVNVYLYLMRDEYPPFSMKP